MAVFSDTLDLMEMKVGEVRDAYRHGELSKRNHDAYMLAHYLLTSGKPHEFDTEHVPTLMIAREMIKRKHGNVNNFPIFNRLDT